MSDTKKRAAQAQEKYRQSEKYLRTQYNNHLLRTYGISLEEYEAIFEAQEGMCKICNSSGGDRGWATRRSRASLFVDHCHSTGKVRGLLCNKCNAGLGMFRDSEDLLTSAISYLKETSLVGH